MKNIISFSVVLCFILNSIAFAQSNITIKTSKAHFSNNNTAKPSDAKYAVLSGKISGTLQKVDSITFWISRNFINTRGLLDCELYTVKVKNNTFKVKVKLEVPKAYFWVDFPGIKSLRFSWYGYLNYGDNLFMNLKPDDATFEGVGSEKLNFLWNVNKNNKNIEKTSLKALDSSKVLQRITANNYNQDSTLYFSDYFKYRFNVLNEIFNQKIILLNSVKPTLTRDEYNFIYLMLYSQDVLLKTQVHIYGCSNSFYKKARRDYYLTCLKPLIASKSSDKYVEYAAFYDEFNFNLLLLDLIYFSNDPVPLEYGRLFQIINEVFKNSLRDKILITSLSKEKSNRFKNIKLHYDHVIKDLKSPHYKNIAIGYKMMNSIGEDFYAFNLPDTAGKRIKLSDLKGKLLIIDFWFTGCENCYLLTKAMEPVFEKYKDRNDVAFLTINMDRSKERWIQSIKNSEKGGIGPAYTHAGSINLSTFPKGFDSDFTKFYGITGAPQLYIIDKSGKTLNLNPQRPTLNNYDKKTDKFIKLIDNYLSIN